MKYSRCAWVCLILAVLLAACAPSATATPVPATPDWFSMELTDVQTGETFTINDYAGKVVLLETMAIWCPNCLIQSGQVQKLHEALGNPDDLISVSLDVDSHEDSTSLKEYAHEYAFEWHFVVAPIEVQRALGNLYSAQYLNPPISPMMVIDRKGNVHHLEYGLKEVDALKKAVEPYLAEK